jgi:hypothetical protein
MTQGDPKSTLKRMQILEIAGGRRAGNIVRLADAAHSYAKPLQLQEHCCSRTVRRVTYGELTQ